MYHTLRQYNNTFKSFGVVFGRILVLLKELVQLATSKLFNGFFL